MIAWAQSFEAAKAQAERERRMLLIDFSKEH